MSHKHIIIEGKTGALEATKGKANEFFVGVGDLHGYSSVTLTSEQIKTLVEFFSAHNQDIKENK